MFGRLTLPSHGPVFLNEGATAQIGFLVVTPYHTVVIECKNLVGDIEIGPAGAFVRAFGRGRGGRHNVTRDQARPA